jgi:predicted DNA binding CopG/RHH family protein
MNNTKKAKRPSFKSEDEERNFWSVADSTDYIDWSKGKIVEFEKLKPSVHSISLRLPDSLIGKLKILANKKDVPYQTLLKIYLSERVAKEFQTA